MRPHVGDYRYWEDFRESYPYQLHEGFQNFNRNKKSSIMSIVWTALIFILNIWILFYTIFWFSFISHPESVVLYIAIIIEWILAVEVLLRIFLRVFFSSTYRNFGVLHIDKKDGFFTFAVLVISSFPIISLNIIINGTNPEESDDVFSYLLILKLLRCFEIQRVLSKLEEMLFYKKFKTLVMVKCVMNLLYIILLTHISACLWLFVSAVPRRNIEIPGDNPHNPYAHSKCIVIIHINRKASLILKEQISQMLQFPKNI